jgi:hypothetical protein
MTELETLISLRPMAKRIWVPSDDILRPFVEIKGGAVPMWYIEKRIYELQTTTATTTPIPRELP